MSVNKNIEDLKKELNDMHKLFDNILSDQKEKKETVLDSNPLKISAKDRIEKNEKETINTTKKIEKILDNVEQHETESIDTSSNLLDENTNNLENNSNIKKEEETLETEPIDETLQIEDKTSISSKLEESTTNEVVNDNDIYDSPEEPIIFIDETVNKESIDDISIVFENSIDENLNANESKVINLHKKEQYLSIREKLEKIKNEIKQKELELNKKKKH